MSLRFFEPQVRQWVRSWIMIADADKVNVSSTQVSPRPGFHPREKDLANSRAGLQNQARPPHARPQVRKSQNSRALQFAARPWTWAKNLPEITSSARAFFASQRATNPGVRPSCSRQFFIAHHRVIRPAHGGIEERTQDRLDRRRGGNQFRADGLLQNNFRPVKAAHALVVDRVKQPAGAVRGAVPESIAPDRRRTSARKSGRSWLLRRGLRARLSKPCGQKFSSAWDASRTPSSCAAPDFPATRAARPVRPQSFPAA